LVNGDGWSSFSVGLASSSNLSFSFLVAGWREMSIVGIDVNNLVHVQLQPHLHKPPRAVDT
jgi:hypothetical protein